ncbi:MULTISPECIES: small, acid-soluble spore protein L [unclassified Sporolactobacillus]|nr:small, acid-soluble spore protein L [Sporolactobacillus sp. CQH2019]MDD9149464.1 small, acid-soluble spore protein L [Sporolactobacillus sp. CQH2019]
MAKTRDKEYRTNKGKTATSVNPAGRPPDTSAAPVSKLEDRARKGK